MQEYMDPKLIEDICAFMLYIDDVFHMYNSDFYYKLWASKFPGDDRHGVLESLKIIRDDLKQRFDLKQKPNYQVLFNGLHYFEQYFVNIAFREMYFNLDRPQILMKQLEVMAKLYNNQECIKKIENLALYKESLANSFYRNLFFHYIMNTYLLTDCMNKLWPDMSSEFYNCGNFMLYFGILVNACNMFYVMQAAFSRECAHKILMRITTILAILKILEINYSIQPDINITTLDFLKFCFLHFMYHALDTYEVKPLFSGLSGLYMTLNYWNMMPEWSWINFLLSYFYYMSIENQMKYALGIIK